MDDIRQKLQDQNGLLRFELKQHILNVVLKKKILDSIFIP